MEQYEQVVQLWKSYNIQDTRDLDKYLDNFRILFAFHSGKIENESISYLHAQQIFTEDKISGFSGDPRTLIELYNQKMCYDFTKKLIAAKVPLSLELIKQIHLTLTSGIYDHRRYIVHGERPGEFKKHDYVTGIHQVGSSADRVEEELLDLVDEVNAYSGKEILKVATYLHVKFEYIHPFADGNGRVGRTLLNYFLMINDHPPLIVYNEHKSLYYDALWLYDESEELEPIYKYFRHETARTWENALKLSSGDRKDRKGLADLVEV